MERGETTHEAQEQQEKMWKERERMEERREIERKKKELRREKVCDSFHSFLIFFTCVRFFFLPRLFPSVHVFFRVFND